LSIQVGNIVPFVLSPLTLATVVGAGVLAMPLALSHMGIFLGTFVIIWAGLTAGFGLYLQTQCAKYLERGSASFFALSQITYPNAAVIFDAAIAIKCFGVGVSYLIIIGDLMPGVVRGFSEDARGFGFLLQRQFWVTAFMWVLKRWLCCGCWDTDHNSCQAHSHSPIIPSPPGLPQIHECYRTHLHQLSGHPCCGTFRQGGYDARSRVYSYRPLGWCDPNIE